MAAWRDALSARARLTLDVDQAVVTRLLPRGGALVVDAGCGGGDFTVLLARAVGRSGWVVAFDADPDAVTQARARLEAADLAGRVELHEEPLGAVPPLDAELVWAGSVVHHLPDQLAGVEGLAALARPGGTVALREGGVEPTFLPFDTGVGEPGLEGRLRVARDRWLAASRGALDGAVDHPWGWPRMLAEAGLTDVRAHAFLLQRAGDLDEGARQVLADRLRWFVEPARAAYLDAADIEAARRLADPDEPAGVARRDDLHVVGVTCVHTGVVPARPAA